MNPLLVILLQSILNISKAHISNALGGEILDTTSFILDAAKAIDDLYQEEYGQPLDWSTIRHHQPLSPPGEPPADSPPADVTNPPDADNPNPENPAES